MGFNIKNNYGPNIEVNDGGKVTLVQGKDGMWHTADAEDAEYEEVVEVSQPDKEQSLSKEIRLSASRHTILDQLLVLVDKGEWVRGITSENLKVMIRTVLGLGETSLQDEEIEKSETLWKLLENGRGERVKIVWQNLIGYFVDRKLLLSTIGAPALNKMFFGDDKGYTNIDKGRPSKGLMTADFESLVPLLDTYVPKVDKKA